MVYLLNKSYTLGRFFIMLVSSTSTQFGQNTTLSIHFNQSSSLRFSNSQDKINIRFGQNPLRGTLLEENPGQVVLETAQSQESLASGNDFTIIRISNPDRLNGYILRIPTSLIWLSQDDPDKFRAYCQRARISLRTEWNHPWLKRDNVGMSIGFIRANNGEGLAEVHKWIPGQSAGSYFQKQEEAIKAVKDIYRTANSDEEFTSNVARLDGRSREVYATFQKDYTDYIDMLANIPQKSYDEVAQMMVEGYQHNTSMDFDHANNIMILPSTDHPKQPRRFGIVDINPELSWIHKMDMMIFLAALLTNNPPHLARQAMGVKQYLIQDPELQGKFDEDLETIQKKCMDAQEKYNSQLIQAAREADKRHHS